MTIAAVYVMYFQETATAHLMKREFLYPEGRGAGEAHYKVQLFLYPSESDNQVHTLKGTFSDPVHCTPRNFRCTTEISEKSALFQLALERNTSQTVGSNVLVNAT